MVRTLLTTLALSCAMPAMADVPERVSGLIEALDYEALMDIMSREGAAYGDSLSEDMFPGQSSPGWDATVADIYAPDRMLDVVADALDAGLSDEALAAAEAFFTSPQGARIVSLEISAREALLDDAVEEAAEAAYAAAAEDPDAFFDRVTRFIEVNDLIEVNVIGGMNSNAAFYLGMADGGGLGGSMSESDILADVYSQEGQIREDTRQWVYSYLLMAYRPLADGDLDAYIAMSESAAGQELNTAMFEGFDRLFVDISRAMGLATAQFMGAQEL